MPKRSIINRNAIISSFVLGVLLLSVAVSVYTLVASKQEEQRMPKAVAGVLDLRQYSGTSLPAISLSGEWQFYWQQFIDPRSTNQQNSSYSFVNTPHTWLDLPEDKYGASSFGYASYKLEVLLPPQIDDIKTLSIATQKMGTNFTLFVNGELLTQSGKPASEKALSATGINMGVYPISLINKPIKTNSLVLIVHISNYESLWGGMYENMSIGTTDRLFVEQSRSNLRSAIMIAAFFTMGVFSLIQYSLRTKEKPPLIMACICFLLALREVEDSQILALTEILGLGYVSSIQISFLTFYLGGAAFISYFYLSFPQDYNRIVMKAILLISFVFSFHVMFGSVYAFTSLLYIFQLLTLGFIAFVIWGLFKAVRKKRFNAVLIASASIALAVLIVNDLLVDLRVINSIPLAGFGLVGLVLCQNYAIYRQFINADDINQDLTEQLGERNTQLEDLSKSLEQEVVSRTSELTDANKKLEVLANEDSLTLCLNRRGLLDRIATAQKNCREKQIPFCFLLIDFDHFKQINDQHGHELGDKVLVLGAKEVKSFIRKNDFIGRWGGEEFLVLLNDVSLTNATESAERIRRLIESKVTKDAGIPVTASIGVIKYKPSETIEHAINRADKQLYCAKSKGRNRVEIDADNA